MRAPRLRVDEIAVERLARRLRRFEDGAEDLDGLEAYLALEAATSLRDLHLVLRPGERNRVRSGLQQSYGDHNRLLLLGLDRLVAGDVDWLASRVPPGEPLGAERLAACAAAVAAAGLARPVLTALWVGAALHDIGMLAGHPAGVDVEDGVAIATPLVDALCDPATADLARLAVRNHDYVKDHELGEVPTAFLSTQVNRLPAAPRAAALLALGMVQVAGAASLGEGRLTGFRLGIFERCADGSLLADASAGRRLALLLGDGDEVEAPPAPAPVAVAGATRELLERVPLHRWHRSWRDTTGDRRARLDEVAAAWAPTAADHVVHERVDAPAAAGEVVVLANGTRALVVA